MSISSDLKSYADKIGLNRQKFDQCVATPGPLAEKIDHNLQSGLALGVSGTPAFFINGRRIAGALPYSEFKRIIDKELSAKAKKQH